MREPSNFDRINSLKGLPVTILTNILTPSTTISITYDLSLSLSLSVAFGKNHVNLSDFFQVFFFSRSLSLKF